jgi:hypothetical protein
VPLIEKLEGFASQPGLSQLKTALAKQVLGRFSVRILQWLYDWFLILMSNTPVVEA